MNYNNYCLTEYYITFCLQNINTTHFPYQDFKSFSSQNTFYMDILHIYGSDPKRKMRSDVNNVSVVMKYEPFPSKMPFSNKL